MHRHMERRNMTDDIAFKQWLKERRRSLDLTQEELAERVGCAVETIKKIEAGVRRPSKQIAMRLAEALDLPPDRRADFVRQARVATPGAAAGTPPATGSGGVDHRVGRVVRGYKLRERIGSGGFGAVYRATQVAVRRDVAVKIILPEYANQPNFIRRFDAEAQLIARLEHPHIVPLYDYWREASGAYLVMRYIRGGSLQTSLAHGAWSLDAATQLLDQVGAALAVAHRNGVVHRDVKPANILLDEEGNAYLADFGIAKDSGVADPDNPTTSGGIIGSPAYLSPEQIRAEPVSTQTDIYSLGIVLYELLAGAYPFADLPPAERVTRQLNHPLPALPATRADLPDAVNAAIQRATAKRPSDRYPDVQSLVADLRRCVTPTPSIPLVDAVSGHATHRADPNAQLLQPREQATLTDAAAQTIVNPYKGLRAFQQADAADFFGREELTQRLLVRLETASGSARFLAVVGPSGSGKSSVVRAGLIPALRHGALPGSQRWFLAEMLPGARPLEELEAALLRVAVNPPPSLLEQLQHDERGLVRAIKRSLPADERTELVLLIDQFEEIFTLVVDERERAHFLWSLVAALADERSRLRLIITLRADFYDRPLLYPAFGELMREGTEVVLPLDDGELRRAIVTPAEHAGVVPELALVEAILADVRAQPGALPLLQYTLTELFEHRQGLIMTLAAYRASEGISGALARRADAIYDGLDAIGQAAARQLFLRLVAVGDGAEDTRRRVRLAELASDYLGPSYRGAESSGAATTTHVSNLLDLYSRYRLLTFDRDPITREPTVEMAHEALIRGWGQLRAWVDAHRAGLQAQRRLATAAAEWAQSGHDPSYLATGGRLAQFETLAEEGVLALNAAEQAFLDASIAERERRAGEERERQRALAASLRRSEALRLAAEASALLHGGGSPELAALLSIRSLRSIYSPQADIALQQAALYDYGRRLLAGHENFVQSVAFSPDGRSVLTGSYDRTARLWDIASGQELQRFAGHTNVIWSVAFSPDGQSILTGSYDRTARIWDVASGQQRAVLEHSDFVWAVAFSPEGRLALTGCQDATARLWDIAAQSEQRVFTGHDALVSSVAFAPDGHSILTGSHDRTARLWDVATSAELRRFAGHTSDIWAVAMSGDGHLVLTGGTDQVARLWDARSGAQLRALAGHEELIYGVTFSPDGMRALTGSQDRTARLWDLASGQQIRQYTATGSVLCCAFAPDGRSVAIGSTDHTARVWDTQPPPDPRIWVGHADGIWSLAFSPDGTRAVTGSVDKTARLWDVATGRQIDVFTLPNDGATGVAFSPDGSMILTGSFDHTARLWDVATGEELRLFAGHTAWVQTVAFSPNGRYALTGGLDTTVRLWDVTTGEQRRIFAGHTDGVIWATFAPDGQTILSGGADATARLWDVTTGAELRRFTGHTGAVQAVAFSPDGRYVLTGSEDRTARIWDVATGAELRAFIGHTALVLSGAAFSPDGRFVLTGSDDKTARLWDVASGEQVRVFVGHTAAVWFVAFSPDGRHVLTGSADKTARLWDVDYHELVHSVCGRLLRDFTDDERAQYGISNDGPTCPHTDA